MRNYLQELRELAHITGHQFPIDAEMSVVFGRPILSLDGVEEWAIESGLRDGESTRDFIVCTYGERAAMLIESLIA